MQAPVSVVGSSFCIPRHPSLLKRGSILHPNPDPGTRSVTGCEKPNFSAEFLAENSDWQICDLPQSTKGDRLSGKRKKSEGFLRKFKNRCTQSEKISLKIEVKLPQTGMEFPPRRMVKNLHCRFRPMRTSHELSNLIAGLGSGVVTAPKWLRKEPFLARSSSRFVRHLSTGEIQVKSTELTSNLGLVVLEMVAVKRIAASTGWLH